MDRVSAVRKQKKGNVEVDGEVNPNECLDEFQNDSMNDRGSAPESSSDEADGENADSESPDEFGELESALQEAHDELNRHREAMLRMQAEMDNQRKRLVRETEKSRKFALERMMKDLLQVHDSLQRGLEIDCESATVDGLREGEALTLKMLVKVLQDHGLEIVDPSGETFNPEFHEAVTMAPSGEYAENTVMEVLQKGFRLHDRLIRPAMVVVSRGSD